MWAKGKAARRQVASPLTSHQPPITWKPDYKLLRREQLLGKVAYRPLAQGGGVTFTVDSTGDGEDANPGNGTCATSGGVCTLRAAIEEANETAATDTIAFNISGSGPHTIQPGSELPALEETVIIDGTTEPDFSGTPVIELDGSSAGASADGLEVEASNTVIRGLVINQFDDDGLDVDDGLTGIVIEGNYIGTNVAGTAALGNGSDGIDLSAGGNTIGGTAAGKGNLISGNSSFGLKMSDEDADGNVIQGNIIGTNVSGTAALGNGLDGIYIQNGKGASLIMAGPSVTINNGALAVI